MIEDADEDGSGSINFPEFVGLMMKKQEGSISKDEIKQVWTRSGVLDPSRHFFSSCGQRAHFFIKC